MDFSWDVAEDSVMLGMIVLGIYTTMSIDLAPFQVKIWIIEGVDFSLLTGFPRDQEMTVDIGLKRLSSTLTVL